MVWSYLERESSSSCRKPDNIRQLCNKTQKSNRSPTVKSKIVRQVEQMFYYLISTNGEQPTPETPSSSFVSCDSSSCWYLTYVSFEVLSSDGPGYNSLFAVRVKIHSANLSLHLVQTNIIKPLETGT